MSSNTVDRPPTGGPADEITYQDKPEGPIAAAILAGGVGCLAMGVLTTLSEASTGFNTWLNWSDPVGPLSGKTTLTVIIWLVAWAGLHLAYRRSAYETRRALTIALVLIALGVLGTFPTFFPSLRLTTARTSHRPGTEFAPTFPSARPVVRGRHRHLDHLHVRVVFTE